MYMEKNKNKQKIEVYFTAEQKAKIKFKSNEMGITMTEFIKRSVEKYLLER